MVARISIVFAVLLLSVAVWAQHSAAVSEGSQLTLFALGLLGVIIGRRASMGRQPDRD